MRVDLAVVEDLLRHVLGSQARLVHYQALQQRDDDALLVATLAHPTVKVTVKLAGPDALLPCPFDRTAALHGLIRSHTGVPVADALGFDVSYQHWPWRYIVMTFVEGQEWATVREGMNADELQAAYRQLGDAVAQLHSLRFAGFGEVSAEGIVSPRADYLDALSERARRGIPDDHQREQFVTLLEDHRALFGPIDEASLCHEDLHQHNIVFALASGRWRLAAILDFDKAWAGHHESDLARLEFWDGMMGPGFWEAYTASRPLSDLYPQRQSIYQLMWCLEYARNTPRHLADTQQLCVRLGLPPIRRFS